MWVMHTAPLGPHAAARSLVWLAWCLTVTIIHWLLRGDYDESLVLGEAIVLADKAYPRGACRFTETSQR